MRQEPIYVVNNSECVKNRVINTFNTSSDFCVFSYPLYVIDETGVIGTGLTVNNPLVHKIDKGVTEETLLLHFNETYDSITGGTVTFNIEVYKYNEISQQFGPNPVTTYNNVDNTQLTNNTGYTINLDLNRLQPDGEYIVKTKFNYTPCTYVLRHIAEIATTNDSGGFLPFGNYNESSDGYFIIMTNPDKPELFLTTSEQTQPGVLYAEQFIIEENQQTVTITNAYVGSPIITLNGLTMFEFLDYTITNNVVVFNDTLFNGDLINAIYIFNGGNNTGINNEFITAGNVVSGVTGGEGNNTLYYNTDTNKFEAFIQNVVSDFNTVIITLNGATLMNGVDYVQSTTNNKKIIFNGVIENGDLINIFYVAALSNNPGTTNPNMTLFWSLSNVINNEDGGFIVYLSEDVTFTSIIDTVNVPYEDFTSDYSTPIFLPGEYGDVYYIKVVNQKQFTTLNNELLSVEKESDILSITLNSNANNSY